MDSVQKEKTVSANFSHAVFFLWDFLNLEAGLIGCTKMLVWNYFSMLRNIQQISQQFGNTGSGLTPHYQA